MKENLYQGTAQNAPLTAKEAALYLGFSVETLRKWRASNRPPIYSVHNKRIYYNQADLDAFINSTFCPSKSDWT